MEFYWFDAKNTNSYYVQHTFRHNLRRFQT